MASNQDGTDKGGTDRRITAAERQRRALQMRKSGATFEAIARAVGYSNESGARKAINTALKKLILEPADELRKLECERLDVMLHSLWPDVLQGKPRSIEVALKVMDRRAALLGLDAPKQVEDHRIVSMQVMADQIAEETGLDADELIAEAERIIKNAAGGG